MNNQLYQELEKQLKPIILAHSVRLANVLGWQLDDAMQEVSIALFKGLGGFDYNKGTLKSYANTVLRNTVLTIITRSNAQRRVPHIRASDKGLVTKLFKLVPIDDAPYEPAALCAEDFGVEYGAAKMASSAFMKRLAAALTVREFKVFKCTFAADDSYIDFLRSNKLAPSHASVAKHLGLNKNAVDYCALAIRLKMTKLAEQCLPEVVSGQKRDGTWPMLHISRKTSADLSFIQDVIRQRGLNPTPLAPPETKATYQKEWARQVQYYEWGATLILKNGAEFRTLVIEGKLNLKQGLVHGESGTAVSIPDVVRWYAQMTRALK